MTTLKPVAVNLAGIVETPQFGSSPFGIDVDGRPYVPVGDGGVVTGLELGHRVFDHDGDHAAPGVTVIHPDPAARHALTSFACLGNEVVVRSGAAAGETGRVLGKRGEAGRVIAVFEQQALALLVPGDALMIRGIGQGLSLPAELAAEGAAVLNIAPGALAALGVTIGSVISTSVRAVVPSKLVGNGLGRPAQQWDVDLSVTRETAGGWGLADLCLGDLVLVSDLDVRHNIGYRQGWSTLGVIVHGASPLPGHGPGLMPVVCARTDSFAPTIDPRDHRGATLERIACENRD
ncbi:DUF4438 domain-containing protein [Mumia qirimensis]|uniref:DUF4438 family protein n=1 Tax=Mumia qirimensis TaxID=3234852 RepID=UPI00351CBD83